MAESLLIKSQEILDRLAQTFESEGLEFELMGVEGETLNLRGKRVGPGVPAAFMVRAISGTFKRYLPDIKDVCLLEYDPGPEGMKSTRTSPDFEKVLRHQPPTATIAPRGIPALELAGLDRRDSVLALEGFVKLWNGKISFVRIYGGAEDPARRAVEKWGHYYSADGHRLEKDDEDRWTLHLGKEAPNPQLTAEERIPGRIFLIDDERQ